jgi:prepilin-type N-terminal cleavage/methylation domain-containing protein
MNTPASSPAARRDRQAFSLVEMLAVLAVIAIVTAVAVPVVTSLSKGSSRRAGVAVVVSVLEQTRGLALSQNSAHYLALADNNTDWPANFRCRSFAIFQEVFNPSLNRYDRLPVTGWTQLPEGLSFDPGIETQETSVFRATDNKVKLYCQPLGKELELHCFKFNSLGGLDAPAAVEDSLLRLIEGTVNVEGKLQRSSQAVGRLRDEIVRVSPVTGRARREDTIAGGTPTPSPGAS